MLFGSFVCQINIELPQKQPVVVLCQQIFCKRQKNKTDSNKTQTVVLLSTSVEVCLKQTHFYKRKKLLFCVCFGFCYKIYAIVRRKSQNYRLSVFMKTF